MSSTPYLICTPETVGTWLLYPAWLCMPDAFPRGIVLDFADLDRSKREADSRHAAPYDLITWDTLRAYMRHGFLLAHDPQSALPYALGSSPLSYATVVPERQLRELQRIADGVIATVSKQRLHEIMYHSYTCWRQFGLEMKSHFKKDDPLFEYALLKTDHELVDVAAGRFLFDPRILLTRHIMKLLVGLEVRKAFISIIGGQEGDVRVFDTPEYIPASRLIARHLDISPQCFAIPETSPDTNEQLIAEVLKIDRAGSPLLVPHVDLLHASIESVREMIRAGLDERDIRRTIASETAEAQSRLRTVAKKKGLADASTLLSAAALFASAVSSPPPARLPAITAALFSLISLVYGASLRSTDEIRGFPPYARFIASRDFMSDPNLRSRPRRGWATRLLLLARQRRFREVTAERISRQLMEAWVTNSVWYDPA